MRKRRSKHAQRALSRIKINIRTFRLEYKSYRKLKPFNWTVLRSSKAFWGAMATAFVIATTAAAVAYFK